jgi:hypothetical protein
MRSRIAGAVQASPLHAAFPVCADPVGPELAAFIASRGDWAFTLHSGMVACVTLQTLRDGDQARQLVADLARAVTLIGR